jgi:PleD family two-component response regulator
VTTSIGVALWRPGDTIDALLDRADLAMYAAKTSGRNRVMAEAMQLDLSEHA